MNFKKEKVLVTGSAGFIGMHTVLALVKEGHDVIGLDNLNTYYSVDLKLARLREQGVKTNRIQYNKLQEGNTGIRFIQLDLADNRNLEDLFDAERFTKVIHLAAQAGVRYSIENPHAYIDANIKGYLDILECCQKFKVEHLVYASSSSVYGTNEQVPFKENHRTDSQVSLYAATKKANEAMAHSYASVHGIPVTGLRFFTVYGPYGRPDMAISKFTGAILRGETIDVYNNGQLSRDFTYISDIVAGIVKLMHKTPSAQIPYAIYNIGRGKAIPLMDFIEAIELASGRKAKMNLLPMQPGDVHRTWADVSELSAAINYTPQVNLQEGISEFVAWYKTYHRLD